MTAMMDSSASLNRTLLWDEENRLKKTTDSPRTPVVGKDVSIVTTYGYGADGMRAVKKGKYGTVQYVSENYVVRNKDLISKHVFAGNTRLVSNMVMREEKSGKMISTEQGCYYYHADHLGSSSVVTDKDGKFYEQIEYFPYGETWVHNKATSDDSAQSTPYKFTGKELDPETGLYYFGARYYDGKLSRWTAADPILGKYLPDPNSKKNNENLSGIGGVYRPLNLDLYHYAGNNPVIYIDPDGNEDILFIQIPGKEGRFESKAYAFPDGTFNDRNLSLLKMDYSIFGNFISIDLLVRINIGSNYKAFDDFSTLPDSTEEYGTVQSGKLYNYTRHDFKKMLAYVLTDPDLGEGKVPQDMNYGKPGLLGKNPAFPDRDPAYILGAHNHRARKDGSGGSKACPIQKGFEEAGGLGHYLKTSQTGENGRVIIYREK